MNRTETAALLALCSRYDLRTVGEEDVIAWHAVLEPLHPTDAILAVRRWYGEQHDRIMPGDIRRLVREIRRERGAELGDADPPDADPDQPAAYIAALRAGRRRAVAALRERDLSGLSRLFGELTR